MANKDAHSFLMRGVAMNRTTLTRPLAAGAAMLMMAASHAAAQQQLFTWSGRVDQEIQLTMTGRNITVSNVGPAEPGQRSANVLMSMPREAGLVTVQTREGRGSVDVIQQPTPANGFTTIVRIRDPQGGVGDYRIEGYWQASAGGEVIGRDRAYGRVGDGRTVLQWSGDVDDQIQIRLRGSSITYRVQSGKDAHGIEASFNGIPEGATHLMVANAQGRGSITVVQQPTAENGYTAAVRLTDPQSGFGHYSFDLIWR